MNSLPPDQRGVGAGMSATFQNSAMVLSIGIFFSLIILGLAGSLPQAADPRPGRPGRAARRRRAGRARCRRSSVLFAALLGYNPIKTLLGPTR